LRLSPGRSNLELMTLRAAGNEPLPHLARKARRAIQQEVAAWPAALTAYAQDIRIGSPFMIDHGLVKTSPGDIRDGREHLFRMTLDQARVIAANTYDHLVSVGRLLGDDEAMSIFAHTTLSRSVCEGAVRLAELLDAVVDFEVRLARGGAMLLASATQRASGITKVSSDRWPNPVRQALTDRCEAEVASVSALIISAGLLVRNGPRNARPSRVEVPGTGESAVLAPKIGPLMEKLLPEAPDWYGISSGVSHSVPWVLQTAVISSLNDPFLRLTPDLLEVGAAVQSAIAAASLAVTTYARYYGHDPEPYARASRQRRGILDKLMLDYAVEIGVGVPG
jgi:hypothetical protein